MYFYREAAEFITKKRFNVLLLENDKPVSDVSDRLESEIKKLLYRKEVTQ